MADQTGFLSIALLGTGAASFAQALKVALDGLLPGASRQLHFRVEAHEAPLADLRWLLACDEEVLEAEQAIAALEAHQRLRQQMHQQGLSYQVLRGSPPERQAQALSALASHWPELLPLLPQTGVTSRRPGWTCSDCGDPECEHRMFTALLAGRNVKR